MKLSRAAILLIVVQVLLVSSIAGKYLYERRVCLRVWTRAEQVDPDSPLRGRYLVLPLRVDACGLPQEGDTSWVQPAMPKEGVPRDRSWNATVTSRHGQLVAVHSPSPAGGDRLRIWLPKNTPCERAVLSPGTDLYIPDTAKLPALKPGEELWVEVTVPPVGPPRAIQLAVSGNGSFTPIKFN
jgi:hypothetical protein